MRAFLAITAAAVGAILAGCASAPAGSPGMVELPRLPAWRSPANTAPLAAAELTLEVARLAPGALFLSSDLRFTRINRAHALELVAWARAFMWARRQGRRPDYVPEAFDCDKFAKAFTLAVELSAQAAGVQAQPLAARIFVNQVHAFGGVPAGGAHALVALGTDEGILVLEPQSGEAVLLEQYPNRAHVWRVLIGG